MKRKVNGAGNRAAKSIHIQNDDPADRWIRRIHDNVERLRNAKPSELERVSLTLDADVVKDANALARGVAKQTGVKLSQAKAAVLMTAFQMVFDPEIAI